MDHEVTAASSTADDHVEDKRGGIMHKDDRLRDPDLETMSRDELFARVENPLLVRQLRRVMEDSPFYARKYRLAGIGLGDLSDSLSLSLLPFTEKSEVIVDQNSHPPFGENLAVDPAALRRVHRTSGHSGRPVYVAYTLEDIAMTLEAGARSFWCAGVRPGDVVIHCLNYCLWTGGLTDHHILEYTGACVVPYGVGNSRNLVDTIRYLRPTAISCTPSYLATLELLLRDEFQMQPRDLGLKVGLFGGEAGIQDHAFRSRIEELWGLRAVDANYGVSDVLSIFGAECECRDGLHFHGQGVLHVELVDPASGHPLPFERGRVGEFVYTTLRRESQPLIRFRSHDLAEIVDTGRCECGRTGFRFRILGRSDDMLVVKGINVFPHAVGEVIAVFGDRLTGEFEIIADSPPPLDHIRLRTEVRPGISAEQAAELAEALQREIRVRLEVTAKIDLVPEGTIPRTEGKSQRIRRNCGE
jgi:phenylacetate-CoA ligase